MVLVLCSSPVRNWRWYVVAPPVALLLVAELLGRTAASDHLLPHPVSHHMSQFLHELQEEYFPECTLLVFHDPASMAAANTTVLRRGLAVLPSQGSGEWRASLDAVLPHMRLTPRLIFNLSHNLSRALTDVDLKTVTQCPVYVTLARNITAVQGLFLLENKDWDKYFLSRRHIIFTDSGAAASIEELLKLEEVNAMTNLLLVQPGAAPSSLDVVTNSPYDLSGPRLLLTWRGGPLTEGTDLFPDKLKNLQGHRMRVVTFHFPPRIFMEEQPDGGDLLYGVDIEV